MCLLEQTSHLPSSPCCLTHHLPACKAVKITCAVGQYAPWRITTFASIIILVEHLWDRESVPCRHQVEKDTYRLCTDIQHMLYRSEDPGLASCQYPQLWGQCGASWGLKRTRDSSRSQGVVERPYLELIRRLRRPVHQSPWWHFDVKYRITRNGQDVIRPHATEDLSL
jgi:hypothetical protein